MSSSWSERLWSGRIGSERLQDEDDMMMKRA